jgi:hypothetical protein
MSRDDLQLAKLLMTDGHSRADVAKFLLITGHVKTDAKARGVVVTSARERTAYVLSRIFRPIGIVLGATVAIVIAAAIVLGVVYFVGVNAPKGMAPIFLAMIVVTIVRMFNR